jgi:LPPG:FO 2-phospho-L-lactate transferase
LLILLPMLNPKSKIQNPKSSVVALAGGVGGAKLSSGLQAVLSPGSLTVVVNTADDFRLWGLHISPDLDTVMYTLAGMANSETGWGLAGDTWSGQEMLGRYGRDTWFRLGDLDMVTHVLRTQMLSEGLSLTDATGRLAASLGIPTGILPMCDERVETLVETSEGTLSFQDYFVRRRHADEVIGVTFDGIDDARPTTEVSDALAAASAIIFCPSNPIVSIGPILAVPGMQGALERSRSVKVAVSPIVGGVALKGPAADMLRSMGHEVSPVGVAALYAGVIHGMVIDRVDEHLAPRIEDMGIKTEISDTIMSNDPDRVALAEKVLEFCSRLGANLE